jgi:hypothetical protein
MKKLQNPNTKARKLTFISQDYIRVWSLFVGNKTFFEKGHVSGINTFNYNTNECPVCICEEVVVIGEEYMLLTEPKGNFRYT